MKNTLFFTGIIVFLLSSFGEGRDQFPGLSLPVDPVIQSMVDSVSADSLEAYVRRLEGFYTRRVLTDSHKLAGQWIAQKYSDWNYPVEYDSVWVDSTYYNYTLSKWYEIGLRGFAQNIIAPVKGTVDSQSIYIYGGHYDSYGESIDPTFGSLYLPAPGAEDNASGTACVMECARLFKDKTWESSLKFIGFGSEELGYSSAHHYAMQAYLKGWDIKGMVGFDLVGSDASFLNQVVNSAWGNVSDELIEVYSTVASV
ncbi:MAG: M28 family peptidase, partial [bacterium]|nr:M28 family peptidase [bacterium]